MIPVKAHIITYQNCTSPSREVHFIWLSARNQCRHFPIPHKFTHHHRNCTSSPTDVHFIGFLGGDWCRHIFSSMLTWVNHCSFFYANPEYLASLGSRT